jgi:D-alanine-D-alanine ligase
MRLDRQGHPYLLEINSLPSLGEHGSYVAAAEQVDLDFSGLVNRLVEVASARYFGTPSPPELSVKETDPGAVIFEHLTTRRETIEKRLRDLVSISSRTGDPIGIREAAKKVGGRLRELGLRPAEDLTEEPFLWTWTTPVGLDDGTLFIGHIDIPIDPEVPFQGFRRGPEWLHGEGIGLSRAPLVMLEFALRSLKTLKRLSKLPLGVLLYADEGRDCEYSAERIRRAAHRAARVMVLRPGGRDHHVVTHRRGLRKFRFTATGEPQRLGQSSKHPEILRWTWAKLEALAALSSRKDRLAVSAVDVRSESYPMLLPHRVRARVLLSYPDSRVADETESVMRRLLGKGPPQWELEHLSDRPPMRDRKVTQRLAKDLGLVAAEWEIPFATQSSVWPSVAGLVPSEKPVLCGLGPVARDLYIPSEAVQRISLPQRTLLLAQFLASGETNGATVP